MNIEVARKKILDFGKANIRGHSGKLVEVEKTEDGWKATIEVIVKNKKSSLTGGYDPNEPKLPNLRELYEIKIEDEKVVAYKRVKREKI